jgi:DNA topoisomerase VI subunit B
MNTDLYIELLERIPSCSSFSEPHPEQVARQKLETQILDLKNELKIKDILLNECQVSKERFKKELDKIKVELNTKIEEKVIKRKT